MKQFVTLPKDKGVDVVVGFSICEEELMHTAPLPRDAYGFIKQSKIPMTCPHYLGGTSFDIAVLLHNLGYNIQLMATVGKDESGPGRLFVERLLKEYKFPYHLFPVRDGTSAARIHIERGRDPIIFSHKTPYLSFPLNEIKQLTKKWRPAVVVASGVMPEEVPMVEAMFEAHPSAFRILNPRAELTKEQTPFERLLKLNPLVCLNHQELSMCIGVDISEDEVTKEKVDQMHEKGVDAIIVTCNEHGSILSYPKHKLWIHQSVIRFGEPVDKTGAGDSFIAAVIAAIFEGKNAEEVMLWGATMAGKKVLLEGGSNVPTDEDFKQGLQR
ncbi:carbohydrate kinase family protein [Patescibacteria group bacterium]|nr:carbohydrate kinase family protein [Patescibacteria group bacterium]